MSKYNYLVKINGKKAANGKMYGVTIDGDGDGPDDVSIYDAVCELMNEVEENNQDMAMPQSIQITLVKK